MIEFAVVEFLEMEEEGEEGSAGSVEDESGNVELVGYIHHGYAEHVDDEAGECRGVRRGGEIGDGVGDILFLGFDEGFEGNGFFGAFGDGLLRESDESEAIGGRGGTEGLD